MINLEFLGVFSFIIKFSLLIYWIKTYFILLVKFSMVILNILLQFLLNYLQNRIQFGYYYYHFSFLIVFQPFSYWILNFQEYIDAKIYRGCRTNLSKFFIQQNSTLDNKRTKNDKNIPILIDNNKNKEKNINSNCENNQNNQKIILYENNENLQENEENIQENNGEIGKKIEISEEIQIFLPLEMFDQYEKITFYLDKNFELIQFPKFPMIKPNKINTLKEKNENYLEIIEEINIPLSKELFYPLKDFAFILSIYLLINFEFFYNEIFSFRETNLNNFTNERNENQFEVINNIQIIFNSDLFLN